MDLAAPPTAARGTRWPGLWGTVGRLLARRGFDAAALACLRHAAASPGRGAARSAVALARLCQANGKTAEARAAYQRALAADPVRARDAAVLRELAACSLRLGDAASALVQARRALDVQADDAQALATVLDALYDLGRMDEAHAIAAQATARHPDDVALLWRQGTLLMHDGRTAEALPCHEKVLALDPGHADARAALALVREDADGVAAAAAHFEARALEQDAGLQTLAWLAVAHSANGDLAAAEAASRRLLAHLPDSFAGLFSLSVCRGQQGDVEGARQLLERVQTLKPALFSAGSNIAFYAVCASDLDRDQVFQRHTDWPRRYGALVPALAPVDLRGEDIHRRLRIGYVSGDLSLHPVGFLLHDVLRHRDRAAFEVVVFSTVRRPDAMTAALRAEVDDWHEVLWLDHAATGRLVREQRIDILVDLSGHTACHRLGAFMMRPAPVQVSWIGYFHSTGLDAIDYFITDPHTSPSDDGQRFSETPLHLPHTRWCWAPPDFAPPVSPPPMGRDGGVTFGSFNRIEKLTEPVLHAWTRIVLAVPGSRLLLKARGLHDAETAEALTRRFQAQGLPAERLELRGACGHAAMLAEYADIDIALDSFPFCGGLTTLEALWMGVPVVTLRGHSVVSRQSHAVLATIGCAHGLSFDSVDSFVDGAVELASDAPRRAALREQLRPAVANSALCRPADFARDVELLYRRMWHAACAGRRLPAYAGSPGSHTP